MLSDKLFIVFAGPNGSGKSTLAEHFRKDNPDVSYIIADSIAKKEFIDIADYEKRSYQALLFAEKMLDKSLQLGLDTAFETVLSSDYKWRFFDIAEQNGYTIMSVFITTSNPDINCMRVKRRVEDGGHPVEESKIRSRYTRSMNNLPKLLIRSHVCLVYDNSQKEPKLLLEKKLNSIGVAENALDLPWLQEAVSKFFALQTKEDYIDID